MTLRLVIDYSMINQGITHQLLIDIIDVSDLLD